MPYPTGYLIRNNELALENFIAKPRNICGLARLDSEDLRYRIPPVVLPMRLGGAALGAYLARLGESVMDLTNLG